MPLEQNYAGNITDLLPDIPFMKTHNMQQIADFDSKRLKIPSGYLQESNFLLCGWKKR